MRRLSALVLVILAVPGAVATFPYPAPPEGVDPADFAAYAFLPEDASLPGDYAGGDVWKYSGDASGDPTLDSDPRELFGVTGMGVDRAWRVTTGRPDVVIAVMDSGIFWDREDVRAKVYLNAGELPDALDRDGNAVLNVLDFEGHVADLNANGHLDGQDLIRAFSDGVDDDANGYVDDIAGWNALDDNNDPGDEVRYGHGTGEAEDSTGEADNGATIPGTCPNCMVLPVRVGMSFIATDNDFGEGVLFALASGADVIQEALGTVDNTPLAREALRAAWEAGVPVVASAADEASYHHNFPAAHEHTINVNSVTRASEFFAAPRSYLYLNGCTNFGANVAVAVSSTSCSSEATGRGAGIAGLIVSAARNVGLALSANEVRQLMTTTADDIDFSGARHVASPVPTLRYPSRPGFDTYFGYGRLDAEAAVRAAADGRIPPEAEIATPTWWEPLAADAVVEVAGLADARRAYPFAYTLEVGCGLHPETWTRLADASGLHARVESLGALDVGAADAACALARLPEIEAPLEPNEHGLTLRLRVTDAEGRVGEHRKYVFAMPDQGAAPGFPRFVGASGEQSPRFADLDEDGLPELVVSTSEGKVLAFKPDGSQASGFPVATFGHESILHGGVAIADLEGDGDVELVASTYQGRVYVWEHDGALRFTVHSHRPYSAPEMRDPSNRVFRGFVAAPVLADLDGDGDREIVQTGMDRHLYVWDAQGVPVPGFPALVVDRAMMDVVDESTHKLAPKDPRVVGQGAEIVSTPAVADLDGDGTLEIVVGHNEEYIEAPDASVLTSASSTLIKESGLLTAGNGRLHAIRLDGNEMPGFPVKVPDLAIELLPTVGDGIPGSPSIADVDGDGSPEIAIFATVGPAMLFRADGTPYYGRDAAGAALTMRTEAPAHDAPVLPAVGSGVLADITGAGAWRYYAPAAGVQRALDAALPGEQVGARDLLVAYDVATGHVAPGWPVVMEDLMFLTSPAVVDLDADGVAEVMMGSGGYFLHAFDGLTGVEKAGWPKFTGHWLIATPATADWDGDGRLDVAMHSREGWLFVWKDVGPVGGRAPWPTIHHDTANTGFAPTEEAPLAFPLLVPLVALGVVFRRR